MAQKMVKACKILNVPIYCTTQNAAKLGSTVSEIRDLLPDGSDEVDKTAFSMMTQEIRARLTSQIQQSKQNSIQILLLGIESHICITQTALDILALNHSASSTSSSSSPPPRPSYTVYILTDATSSSNSNERLIALARLRHAGAVITTTESAIYEVMGDAAISGFRDVVALVREGKEETRAAVEGLCLL